MVEDLIEPLDASKTEYESRGLDFEGDLVMLYSQLRKTMSEKYEQTDFGPTAVREPTKSMEQIRCTKRTPMGSKKQSNWVTIE